MWQKLLTWKCTGDQVFVSECGGRGAHYNREGYKCNYCEVPSSKLFDVEPSTLQTLARVYALSHSFNPCNPQAFTCPGCGKVFTNVSDIDAESEPLDSRVFSDTHFGQEWHRAPLLHIEPNRFLICILHLLLSCTKLLVKHCILPMLVTEAIAVRFNQHMENLKICIPKQVKRGATAASDVARRVKFTGAECVVLLEHWDWIIDDLVIGAPDIDAARARATTT